MSTAAQTQPYIQRLQRRIYDILLPVLDPDHINIILDEDSMVNYWQKAFIHESVDPENNYQLLEFYGDKLMNNAFAAYIRQLAKAANYPLTAFKATITFAKFMQKNYQSKMAEDMGLVEFIQFDPEFPEVDKSIREDVAEAFFGALGSVLDDKIRPGMGYIYAYNLIVHLFRNVPIDFEQIRKDPVSQLKELYEKMGWGEVRYVTTHSDRPAEGSVKSTVLSSQGDALGVGYGNSKGDAGLEAAKQALDELNKQGITVEYAHQQKLQRNRQNNPEFDLQYKRLEKAIEKINENAARLGKVQITNFKVTKIESHKVAGGQRFTYAVEVAFPGSGGTLNWRRINSLTGDNENQTRVDLMKRFADQNQIPPQV